MKTDAIKKLRICAAELAGSILSAAVVGYGDGGVLAEFVCPPAFETAVRKAARIGEVSLRAEFQLTALEAKNIAMRE